MSIFSAWSSSRFNLRQRSMITHILHELAANGADLLAQCCTEHHNLLLVGCQPEDFLDVTPHVCGKKQYY